MPGWNEQICYIQGWGRVTKQRITNKANNSAYLEISEMQNMNVKKQQGSVKETNCLLTHAVMGGDIKQAGGRCAHVQLIAFV